VIKRFSIENVQRYQFFLELITIVINILATEKKTIKYTIGVKQLLLLCILCSLVWHCWPQLLVWLQLNSVYIFYFSLILNYYCCTIEKSQKWCRYLPFIDVNHLPNTIIITTYNAATIVNNNVCLIRFA